MIILKKGDPTVIKTWGRQGHKEGSWRKIRYLLETPCEDGLLLHHTVTGEVLLLDQEETAAWNRLSGDVPETLGELISRRYLVPEAFDEVRSLLSLRKLLRRFTHEQGVSGYLILPTTGCNARCFYCYESDYPHLTMTEETAEKTVQYILQNSGNCEDVRIRWFGGEPLVGRRIIDYICKRLREEKIPFTSAMTSNGYLFTPELAEIARRDWRLQNVQITLDGTEEIYNRTKAYVGISGSPYLRVLDNIRSLLREGVKVRVRMNLDEHNADDLEKLIGELAGLFASEKNFSCYVHELFDSMGFSPVQHSDSEWQSIKSRRAALLSFIEEKGLSLRGSEEKLASLRVFYCMADAPSAVTVNPLGRLGKCEHFAYEHLVGDVSSGVSDRAEWSFWLNPSYSPGCMQCPLFPDCGIPETCSTEKVCSPELAAHRKQKNRRLALELCRRWRTEKNP